MTTMQFTLLGLLTMLLIAAAVSDLRTRLIPNWLNAVIATLAVAWWWAGGLDLPAVEVQIGLAFFAFGLFAAIFAIGWMGGGDVKLIGALALWLPPMPLLRMLVWMVLAGGVLSLIVLIHHRWRGGQGKPEVPYGVAIAFATLLVFANEFLTIRGA